ncbi:MAG: trigger factor [Actinomycetota bacterium]|nr:trigger factor [Actinomycetota bacterium]
MPVQVEELSDNKVRLTVDVAPEDVQHAVEHATSDLAGSVKIPGFRKGKVPNEVLVARVGKDRLMSEAVESHIGGWFWNAAASSGIRPVAQPEYDYELPESGEAPFHFRATVSVQPKPEIGDWQQLEVPYVEAEVPGELVDHELEALQHSVAELAPVEGRPAQLGDVVIADLAPDEGEAQRDYAVELGSARLLPELEEGLVGLSPGETKELDYPLPDGSTRKVSATAKEIKEKVLPPLDDDLARAASEFETFGELRGDIESRLREQLDEELEGEFRAAAVDALVEASKVDPAGPIVESRTRELLNGLAAALERRGIDLDTYLQIRGQSAEQLIEQLRAEAAQSVAREMVLEAVADKLSLEVTDEEVEELIREQAEATGEDPGEVVQALRESGRFDVLRADLRLKQALDRVVADVQRIEPELASAREKIWTPDKETEATEPKLWTPGTKEPA